jgi:hypothetical protein
MFSEKSNHPADARFTLPIDYLEYVLWDGLELTIHMSSDLSDFQRSKLEQLVDSWYVVSVWGGYGPAESGGKGVVHGMDDFVYLNPRAARFRVDLGSAPDAALHGLFWALWRMREEGVLPIHKVVVGYDRDAAYSADEADGDFL